MLGISMQGEGGREARGERRGARNVGDLGCWGRGGERREALGCRGGGVGDWLLGVGLDPLQRKGFITEPSLPENCQGLTESMTRQGARNVGDLDAGGGG